ncbi:Hydrogen peroxide-inducible genes activator [Pseudooceanicola marinus]|uniref:Hydrogen peroxide-inducible genes activator n=1 Tax=Pseudooceanicola marinus TaxID=396013 RepID=A0A1X6ZGY1_9RHOB|nr:LysR family transcriptional regulator [Pseudooceanicola marinus]PJE28526.1 LysR family transcriptional regulator [Pseudooceanicola marinus]SLN50809.1 Hydrogen peroxide-inducible genes activator [Pseudooceanicola marinus]
MIGKLEMFMALAREQHFGRAAESLGITQPSLSTGIRQLEDQLGVKLVLRGSRFGGLTPEGQRALVWARQIVGDARRLREEMRFAREGLAGHLRIAVIPTALTWASRLATGFRASHPGVEFTILSRNSAEILSMLENFEVEAGISYLDNEPLGHVSTAFLYRERYAAVCRPDHPLAAREVLDWSDFAGQDMCLLTPDMQNRRIINRAFLEAGVAPGAGLESNSTVVLASHVEGAGLITVLPDDLAAFLVSGRNLVTVPVAPGDTGPAVGLVAPYQEPHTPVLQALLDTAEQLAAP